LGLPVARLLDGSLRNNRFSVERGAEIPAARILKHSPLPDDIKPV
jgi:hypothetical protein